MQQIDSTTSLKKMDELISVIGTLTQKLDKVFWVLVVLTGENLVLGIRSLDVQKSPDLNPVVEPQNINEQIVNFAPEI